MDIVFGPIYPYTFGTWIGVGFWWLGILSIVVAVIAATRKEDNHDEKGDGHGA